MNLTISKRVLRWLDPKQEIKRQELRMCLSRSVAQGEDIQRTVKLMNGHLHERIEGLKVKE